MLYTGPGPGELIGAGQGIIYFFIGLFTSVFVDLTELLVNRINIGEIINLNGPIIFIITGAENINCMREIVLSNVLQLHFYSLLIG